MIDQEALLNSEWRNTDEELVSRSTRGDARAFAQLVERYFGMAVAIAMARLGNRETAEEAAQEAFLRAYRRLDTLQNAAVFPAWISRIVRNLSEDWARRTNTRASRLGTMIYLEELPPHTVDKREPDALLQVLSREEAEQVAGALEGLPSDLREVVLLHYYEGLDKIDIARRMGVHASSVGRRLDRALQLMRQRIHMPPGLELCSERAREGRQRRAKAAALALIAMIAAEGKAPASAAPHIGEGARIVSLAGMLALKLFSLLKRGGAAWNDLGEIRVSPVKAFISFVVMLFIVLGSFVALQRHRSSSAYEAAYGGAAIGVCGTVTAEAPATSLK